jgi:hypothetical protein
MPTDLEILKTARQLIESPDKWCRWWVGINADGDYERDESKIARRCLRGAVLKAGGWVSQKQDDYTFMVKHIYPLIPNKLKDTIKYTDFDRVWAICDFNNNAKTTHTDILNLLDTAIEKETNASAS